VTVRENFPVGSVLIRRDLRAAVHAFYRVARNADDLADDPRLPMAQKLARLDDIEAGLDGDPLGPPEARALAALGRPDALHHARRLLRAFRRDAVGEPCRTWADLLAYCEDSANPVGRFLLDLHGESVAGFAFSDALCTALQVLNHLQDLRPDHLWLGRHYLPLDWLEEEGATLDDLGRDRLTPALRRCVDRAFDRCDLLLQAAEPLPRVLASRRLAGESAAILRLARGLSARLRAEDPLTRVVAPSRRDMALAGLAGLATALAPRPAPRLGRERA
jgi:squalene synthase HpnC